MQTISEGTTTIHPIERILAIVGSVLGLIISGMLWWSISKMQSMWPLPGLYFIEMAALGVIGALAFLRGDKLGKFITWGAAGILSGFSIVGAMSVGFFYLPVALIFGGIGISWDARNKQPILAHLGVFIVAGILQAALMFAAIRLLYPSASF